MDEELNAQDGLRAHLENCLALDERGAEILRSIAKARSSKKAADRDALPGLRAELAANEHHRGAVVVALHQASPRLAKLREIEALRD